MHKKKSLSKVKKKVPKKTKIKKKIKPIKRNSLKKIETQKNQCFRKNPLKNQCFSKIENFRVFNFFSKSLIFLRISMQNFSSRKNLFFCQNFSNRPNFLAS